MQRASRGLDTPAGTISQKLATEKLFEEFIIFDDIHRAHSDDASLPTQNFYSLLTAFTIFIQTRKSNRAHAADGLLANATALGYFSQERNLRANVQTNDAPGCTIDDLCGLVEFLVTHADVKTGLKSVHDAALLTMMWHTFGRAMDTCFPRKQQLSIAASGELFLHIARIKTSVVQGVSIYKSPERWQQCMLHAFGLLFICYDVPSEHHFPLAPRFSESDLPGGEPYSQEEATMYWERLQKEDEPPQKRERKRPNIASYITELIRDTLKAMLPSASQRITSGMTSHSLRRGAAAYANASPKLAIQWLSTRGAWLLESLTKAFAYIGTTSKEDQSVAKVLAGFQSSDLPATTPSIHDLYQRPSEAEYGQLMALRDKLYRHVAFTILDLTSRWTWSM
ncbi:hypothetical protein PHYSODRAFT_472196 [Phytophthora sojae]|uniref:Uncharacterized protein n=1 Tax=Phytophthora sojae (strain P6497) TaxID=1094619 RepID=G4YFV2_PHYSP|nr:hypothetical protein PHYSODRAFT_472196 [Phytophthora sojae]EGZ27678.1 hypothetical protein PHYSODRAFT_472196 [Phytophthora sojae]|eukprot:XP_009514953.1 hypothetical protein PHYSODRAFT_472196 [Phytophthora sojae]